MLKASITYLLGIPYSLILIWCMWTNQVQAVSKIEIRKAANNYTLIKDNKPYFIKGAGGYSHLSELKNIGGNSIRTWSLKDARYVLDEAQKNDLTVTLGIDLGRERLGFNYNDKVAVLKQFNAIKNEINKYKDHPALLMW